MTFLKKEEGKEGDVEGGREEISYGRNSDNKLQDTEFYPASFSTTL